MRHIITTHHYYIVFQREVIYLLKVSIKYLPMYLNWEELPFNSLQTYEKLVVLSSISSYSILK